MKKKVFLILFCGVLLISLTGCNDKTVDEKNPNNTNTEEKENVESSNNILLGTWSGNDSANRDSFWTFEENKVTYGYHSDMSVGKDVYSWNGTYKVTDNNTIIVDIEEWEYPREFSYEISDNKYLKLINITEEQGYMSFPSFERLEKK